MASRDGDDISADGDALSAEEAAAAVAAAVAASEEVAAEEEVQLAAAIAASLGGGGIALDEEGGDEWSGDGSEWGDGGDGDDGSGGDGDAAAAAANDSGSDAAAVAPAAAAAAAAATAADDDGGSSGDGDGDDDGSSAEDGASITVTASVAKYGYYITDTLALERGSLAHAVVDADGTERPIGEPLHCINAVTLWTLSSARPGNGIRELLDDDTNAYWQSDGMAPHRITMSFYKRQSVAELALYVDYGVDESYTPAELVVHAGNLLADCEEVVHVRLSEPSGWIRIPFINTAKAGMQQVLRTHVLTLTVLANHQAGRDTHIRCIKVLAPAERDGSTRAAAAAGVGGSASGGAASDAASGGAGRRSGLPAFTSVALSQFATLR